VCSPMFSPIAYRRMSFQTQISSSATEDQVISNISSPGIIAFVTIDRNFTSNTPSNGPEGKLRGFKPTFWLLCASFLLIYGVVWSFTNVSSAILLERDFFKPSRDCILDLPSQCSSGLLVPEKGNMAHNSKGQECPVGSNFAPVIPQSLNITFVEGGQFDQTEYVFRKLSKSDIKCQDDFWSQGCTMDYCEAQTEATEKAGLYMSIPYFFVVALTYHLGLFVDATGYRTEMICLGSVLLVAAHVLLAYSTLSPPSVPLITQGVGYTICVAALWPSVPFTVSLESVGTAFGIMMAVQNFGLALIPLVVARLYRLGNNSYLPVVELFFAGGSLFAVFVGVALKIADEKSNRVLGTPKANIRYSKGVFVVKKGRNRTISDADVAYH